MPRGRVTLTASNADNRPDQLSAASRERVLEAARSLRRGRAGAVGVVLANPLRYASEDPAEVRLLAGISAAAELVVRGSSASPSRA